MDAKKVLKDLQYRIETSKPNDPERENAIRLRDRLLATVLDVLFILLVGGIWLW